jgi:hypothetical protein
LVSPSDQPSESRTLRSCIKRTSGRMIGEDGAGNQQVTSGRLRSGRRPKFRPRITEPAGAYSESSRSEPGQRMSKCNFQKLATVPLLAALLAGCGTLDLASRHQGPAPVCEIHGTTMQVETIQLSSGEIAYVHGFYERPLRTQFPHHGDWVYQGERSYGVLSPRKVSDFARPDCTAAFRRYWKREPS